MDSRLVSNYRHAIQNFKGKFYQSAEKKFIVVLKCLIWPTLNTCVKEVDEAYREKLNKLKYVIKFIGLDQPHLEEMCIVRAHFLPEDSKEQVFKIICFLSRHFEKEMKKETDRYFVLNK